MKAYLLLVLVILLFAGRAVSQTSEAYASQWKLADSLLNSSLPESARKVVNKVYADAQRTSQPVQMLKAQLYFLRINASNREDADSLNIAQAEAQAKATSFPINAVWQSITAQLYWNYYQQHRYEILQRTKTAEQVGNDFEQWDAAKFVEKTSALYLQSISRAEELKRINIEAYDPVLIKGENTRSLRPTLFDLLAFRAIDFFENDEKDLTKPAFAFVMDDAVAFASAVARRSGGRIGKAFISHTFITEDTSSMQYRALSLYQEVLRLHQNDSSPDAFIDADLQRLQFAYAHSVHPDKKTLYRTALERLESAYPDNPLSATASFRIAELMMNEPVVPFDDREDNGRVALHASPDLRTVKAILDDIIAKYPKSEGGIAAQQLLQTITAPSLNLTAEEAILPGEYSKVLVTYKNVPKVFFRVVKIDAAEYLNAERNNADKLTKTLLNAKPVQSFSIALPGTEDYAQHSAEVKIDALPLGMYAILISAKQSFAKEDNALSYAICQSTRLAVITQSSGRPEQPAGYILNRRSGEPIPGAAVAFFKQQYNSPNSSYDNIRTGATTTGSDGVFRVSGTERNYNGMVVTKDDDAFYSNGYLNFYRYTPDRAETEHTFFFTDRSIYRPGQTIFFKGILVHTDDGRNAPGGGAFVQAGRKIEVTFYDANSQKVAAQTLTTNEWGSVTGSFTAPQGGLTGQMRIESGSGSANISVEEYKRPKFRVDWDTLKSGYALGETVAITGHAAAYAGNNVDGATVKYRVIRNVRWPYWWYSWRFGGGHTAEQQMAEGTATTDASGKFSIRFTAQPDRSIDERSLPVFTYTVYADVTDLNGETRSGQKSISAGYRSLQIVADIPQQASLKDLDTVRITTQNLNGDFVAASVQIKVARLDQPEIVYRKRLWAVPDQFAMSEAEFRRSFPLDAYKDEDDYRNWKEADSTFSRSVTTTRDGNVALPKSAFTQDGWYVITLSAKDKNGKPIEEKKFVNFYEGLWGKNYSMLSVNNAIPIAEPGKIAFVETTSDVDGLYIIRQVQTMDGQVETDFHSIGDKTQVVPYSFFWRKTITEADRGGIALSYITVKDNRVYTASARIDVPWTNKDLSIEWETHRDKLLPGQQETWTMIVGGNKKDKVAAEMAAALYDASLDAFKPHGWGIPGLFPSLNADLSWQTGIGFGQAAGRQVSNFFSPSLPSYEKNYDQLIGLNRWYNRRYLGNFKRSRGDVMGVAGGLNDEAVAAPMVTAQARKERPAAPNAIDGADYDKYEKKVGKSDTILGDSNPQPDIPIRKNLQETAFFYPQLHTDADGAVRIQFTIPEALTEWKLLAFAHTKEMRTGYTTGTAKTQKDLMMQPGLPRFLRQGDELSISAKIVNLSDGALNGTATLEITDALTGKPLDIAFRVSPAGGGGRRPGVEFTAPKDGSTNAAWTVHVPESIYEPVIIRIYAKAGAFTDGEENTLPVLTNRMLVTETMTMWMNGAGTKTFSFEKLKASGGSNTIAQHRLTLEYTANPAWYAVQALPYLMEYPYECAEQTFNRYYANALAAHILAKAPQVKEIFRKWEALDTAALQSNLEKNQELKSALLEETPWVLDAQNETAQKHNIALLFNSAKLARSLNTSAQKLEDMFLPEGGWPWFKGDNRPDRYITQYIVTGIGRLQHLGVENARLASLSERAVSFLDGKMNTDYKEMQRRKAKMSDQHISYFEVQYLYMRSFFRDIPQAQISGEAMSFYKKQAQQFWPSFNPYVKGMIAIALQRGNDVATPKTIIQSLKETAIQKEELGMYWMDRGRSWWWWEAPIEAQSLLIECFSEVAKDNESVDKMKRWLLKQKQTQNWGTTKGTADACYALLLQGTQWLTNEPQVTIQLGDASAQPALSGAEGLSARKTIRSQDMKAEAGTGYFKVQYPGAEVKPEMGNVTLTVERGASAPLSDRMPSWGAVYWQYFENLDKITSAATPLVVKKQLFIESNSDRGPVLESISGNASIKIGDKVKARIEITVDRDMEYVHLKDGRASCFEPVNVLSGYRWQGGLGYYESTKDASSNFFFSYLPKGKYVFEYPMFVTSAGDFSNGIATIQCMYAPEFSAHSEGVRVLVR